MRQGRPDHSKQLTPLSTPNVLYVSYSLQKARGPPPIAPCFFLFPGMLLGDFQQTSPPGTASVVQNFAVPGGHTMEVILCYPMNAERQKNITLKRGEPLFVVMGFSVRNIFIIGLARGWSPVNMGIKRGFS